MQEYVLVIHLQVLPATSEYRIPLNFHPSSERLWGTAVAQWVRCCATNRKVAGSIPAAVIEIFH